ncbi:tetratricopeptide repeat protein [Nocardiopsis dassonvillei]|uniref:tetratricopeptide repeat protein n=1 Tax=Nocardiopsis dassonvillei TaxID=2014 RepID=UPI003670E589
MSSEGNTFKATAAHIEQKWIKAGRDVIGQQVIHLPQQTPTALHTLPLPPATLAGRTKDLGTLLAALDPAPANEGASEDTGQARDESAISGGVVLSTLAGMGGVGKTALVLAAGAIAQHEQWFCAELFVDLRGYAPGAQPLSAEAALDILLRQMGVNPQDIPPGEQERSAFYRSALQALSAADEQHRPVLVVADNANSASQVRPLLPGVGGHRLVATTRGDLSSLIGARHLDLELLDLQDAIALLATALRTGDSQDMRAKDEEGLSRLAQLCGRLPLALEIVAAQLLSKARPSPAVVAERLEKAVSRVDKLKAPGRDVERSRVLRAVFDTSLDQLAPDQVRVFLLVASAPGPTTSTASAAVLIDLDCDEAVEVLEELQAAHLLTQPVEGRWAAHDLLADHARTHPRPPTDRDQATARLLDHYTATANAADDHVRALPGQPVPGLFPDRNTALVWLNTERATLVAAALAAPTLEHTEAAIALPLNLGQYLERERHFEDLEQVSCSARTTAHAIGDQIGEASAWNNLGLALRLARRFHEAIDAYTRSCDLHQQVGDVHSEAAAWNNLGNALRQVRRLKDAVKAHTRARDLHQQVGDVHGEALAWNNLGASLQAVHRFTEAVKAHTRAREAFHALGDAYHEAQAWNNLGASLQAVHRFTEAVKAHTRARILYQQTGYTHGQAGAWNNIGAALQRMMRFPEAIEAYTRAREAFRDTGDVHSEAAAWNNIGAALQEMRQFEEAIEAYTRALGLYQQTGAAHNQAMTWNNLGLTLAGDDRPVEAVDAVRQAVKLYEVTGDEHQAAISQELLARIQQKFDDDGSA